LFGVLCPHIFRPRTTIRSKTIIEKFVNGSNCLKPRANLRRDEAERRLRLRVRVCVLPIIFQSILWETFLHHHVHPPSRTYCIQVPQASTEHVVACESGVCLCMVWVCGCVYVVVCAVVWLCVCVRVCVHVHACVLMRPHAQCVDVFVCACVDLLNTSPTHKNPRINYVLCLFPPPLSLAPFLARLCVSRFA